MWATRQTEWEEEAALVVEESQKLSPKFQPGMLVKFSRESGCNLLGDCAEVVDSRYVSSEDWSGWDVSDDEGGPLRVGLALEAVGAAEDVTSDTSDGVLARDR